MVAAVKSMNLVTYLESRGLVAQSNENLEIMPSKNFTATRLARQDDKMSWLSPRLISGA